MISRQQKAENQSRALTIFAVAITALNVVGHFFLGFEGSFLTPLVALGAAYTVEIVLGAINSALKPRKPAFLNSPKEFIMFLRPAHITGLACSMLLFVNHRLWALVFAVTVAIASKHVLRVRVVGAATRHFFNPSNAGITLTLLVFPWVGIAPPYQFTEQLLGWTAWVLPAFILFFGARLNLFLTLRLPLIIAWMASFAAQALIRNLTHGTSITSGLEVMTGVAFVLFTFYMITDPMTTPDAPIEQVLFGVATALAYAIFMELHIVFGLFFALTFVCAVRGALLALKVSKQSATALLVLPAREELSERVLVGRSNL